MEAIDLEKFCIKYKKVYIFGAGVAARFVASELERLGLKYDAFVVSDGFQKSKLLYDHKILYLSEVDPSEDIGFILGLNKENSNEVLNLLNENGYNNYLCLTDGVGMVKNSPIQRLSLRDRCNLIQEYSRKGVHIAVLLCGFNKEYRSTYRYRAHNMQQIMDSVSSKWKVVYFFIDEIDFLKKYFLQISIITLLRLKWTFELENFIQLAKEQKISIMYDIDDLIFDLDYLPLVMDTIGIPQTEESYQKAFSTTARYFLLASKADRYIATNKYLAQKLIKKFSRPCAVIPNFLNNEQLKVSKQWCMKTAKKDFVIGYFSGAHVHTKDFRTCYKEIILLMEEFPNIKLRVVGYLDFPEEMGIFLENGRIETIPLVDFEKLQQLISEVDVNIAPLIINDYTNCKSELKFFEAAVVKTITCASPTYVFRNCIKDGVNGFLCNEGDWYKKIKKIYLGEFNLAVIRDNAYRYALQNYTGLKIVERIEDVYSVFNDIKNCNIVYEKVRLHE